MNRNKISRQSGWVYLVGAGPGDPGLLTLKGKMCLEGADVVIYDALVSPVLLDFVSADAELIYAGKRGGQHCVAQNEINATLIRHAGAGLSAPALVVVGEVLKLRPLLNWFEEWEPLQAAMSG